MFMDGLATTIDKCILFSPGFCLYSITYPEVVRDERTGVSLTDFMEDNG
jgi:hypothetical protein